MARHVARGEIWQLQLPRPDRRRPVLVLSRQSLIPLLHTVTVATVTRTRRGSPTEVELGVSEGLKRASCVNLCNVFTVEQARLSRYIGTASSEKMRAVCKALSIANGCD